MLFGRSFGGISFWYSLSMLLRISIFRTCTYILIRSVYSSFYKSMLPYSEYKFFPILLFSVCSSPVFYIGGIIYAYCYQNNYFENKKVHRPKDLKKQDFDLTLSYISKGEVYKMILFSLLYFGIANTAGISHVPEDIDYGNILPFFLRSILFYLLTDLSYFLAHFYLHENRSIYWIHAKHHEYSYVYSYVSGYKSIQEAMITSVTNNFPFFLYRSHFIEFLSWKISETVYDMEYHSGYSWLLIPCNFHDFHHYVAGSNFGVLMYLDYIFGTSKLWKKSLEERGVINKS